MHVVRCIDGVALYTIPKCANTAIRRALLEGLGFGGAAAGDRRHPALNCAPVADYPGFRVAFLAGEMDFTGCVETLSADWAMVRERAPWLPAIGRHHATGAGADWRPHYDDATRDLVARIYAADLALWRAAAAEREIAA